MNTCPICGNVTAAGDEDVACSDCFLASCPPSARVVEEDDDNSPEAQAQRKFDDAAPSRMRYEQWPDEDQRDEDHFNNAE